MAATDIVQAFDPPVTDRIGGVDVAFPIIPFPVFAAKVASEAKAAKKARAKEMVDEFKLTGEDKLVVLKDGATFTLEDAEAWVNTPDGSAHAVRVSLEQGGKSKDEIDALIAKVRPVQVNRLALVVCQFLSFVQVERPADEDSEKTPDPTPPPAAQ